VRHLALLIWNNECKQPWLILDREGLPYLLMRVIKRPFCALSKAIGANPLVGNVHQKMRNHTRQRMHANLGIHPVKGWKAVGRKVEGNPSKIIV